jgi:tol-pal system protein YbgF
MNIFSTPQRLARYAVPVLILMASVGCARHADFVQVRDDLRQVAKAQEQDRKQYVDLQNRLTSLEAKLDTAGQSGETAALRQRIEELSGRLRNLETRLARLSETPPMPAPRLDSSPTEPPTELSREPSRQSSPAKLPPLPEPTLPLPGTPDITPTSAYNLAYNDYLDGRYEMAIAGFQRFLNDFPTTSLAANAQYWIGESHYSLKNYAKATEAFEAVVNNYPRSDKAAPALFKLGVVAAETGDVRKARLYLKRVIEEFSGSNEAKLAKNKLAEIR